jgi:hypothetical protein
MNPNVLRYIDLFAKRERTALRRRFLNYKERPARYTDEAQQIEIRIANEAALVAAMDEAQFEVHQKKELECRMERNAIAWGGTIAKSWEEKLAKQRARMRRRRKMKDPDT